MTRATLSIDTASPRGVVTISQSGRLLSGVYLEDTHWHAECLPDAVHSCLAQAQLAWSDISSVVVGHGPGSFIGVRIGMSYAKGICVAQSLPLLTVCSLTALAAEPLAPLGEGLALIDARRGQYYARKLRRLLVDGVVQTVAVADATTIAYEELDLWREYVEWIVGVEVGGPSFESMARISQTVLEQSWSALPNYCREPSLS